ncbi:hypothetical protein [Tahibacter soli]|uniref:Uncharacterized protein n=1 Tax=Tahibacter soli TaxID=2983605 RepID=A0A9X4BH36_9GAMM|nr:hypothetical protein [Tahibacter soli]MDC8011878.1 hypothetical protein [Tahibacter soli]
MNRATIARAVVAGASLAAMPAVAATFGEMPQIAGLVRDARLAEISGLTASRRAADRYWVHNDSGDRAELFAIDSTGAVVARVMVDGYAVKGTKKPVDWEDVASFEENGKAYLAIGDIGDNGGVRPRVEIVVIEEPDIAGATAQAPVERRAQIAWRTRFRYADAPHDAEALAIDADAGQALIVTKRTYPPMLWRVPLRSDGEATAVALGPLRVPASNEPEPPASLRVRPRQPTGLSIDRTGSQAAVLTYRAVWLYARAPGQSWAQAFATEPQVLPIAGLPQGEAIGFDASGTHLYVTGERWPAPLIRYDWKSVARPSSR